MTKYEADQIFKSRLQNEDYNTIAKRMSIKVNTIASYCYRNGLTDSNLSNISECCYCHKKIEQKENADVYIEMTVTSPMCPVAGVLPQQAAEAVASLEGVGEVEVRIVWEPAWSLANLSDEAKEMFEMF